MVIWSRTGRADDRILTHISVLAMTNHYHKIHMLSTYTLDTIQFLRSDVLVSDPHLVLLPPVPHLSPYSCTIHHHLLLHADVSRTHQRPNILVQSIPLQISEEWKPKNMLVFFNNILNISRYLNLGQFLNLGHSQLLLDGKTMKKV